MDIVLTRMDPEYPWIALEDQQRWNIVATLEDDLAASIEWCATYNDGATYNVVGIVPPVGPSGSSDIEHLTLCETNAPSAYDYRGTIEILNRTAVRYGRSMALRTVLIPSDNVVYQCGRYESGMYLATYKR